MSELLAFRSALKMRSSSLLADHPDKSSCIGVTEVTMKEESFPRVQQLGRHRYASRWRTPTHGRKRRDGLVFQFYGRRRRPHGGDSWSWPTQMVDLLRWQR